MISIIVAIAQNGAIGYKGDLIYHLSADLRRFKELTTGNTVIMGRKTFESLPKGALPNRRNIVLTRQQGVSYPGTEVYSSLDEALSKCARSSTEKVLSLLTLKPKPGLLPFDKHFSALISMPLCIFCASSAE